MDKKIVQKNSLVQASQVAFELEQKIAKNIRKLAAQEGIAASDQIRKIIGLSYSSPKRPRLSISLSNEDYLKLGKKYNISSKNTIEIKRQIIQDLIKFF
ncbi:hypothetical protein N9C35_02255 [Flavobacteriaceae bacterium]|nr:hypothetical protein [Flavobacteriaceae bacterium]